MDKKYKYKALIVDDDKDLVEVLSDIFTNAGFKVITAFDGMDATFKYNNEPFDIILSDIRMPKKDGIKFVQHIHLMEAQKIVKVGPSFKRTPVILISASVEEFRVELEVLGHIEVLNKPFTPKQVMDKVYGLIEKKTEPQASTGQLLSFKSGETIMSEGDNSQEIFFIKEGSVNIYKRSEAGREILVTSMKSGEMLGEVGVLMHRPRTATAVAVEDTILISIPKEKFESHFAAQPKWFKILFETITTRLEDTTKLLVEERANKS